MEKMFDYQICLTDGISVNEAVTENADGSYTVFVNSHLNDIQQKAAVEHAFRHIRNNDFEKHDVQQIELSAHGMEG